MQPTSFENPSDDEYRDENGLNQVRGIETPVVYTLFLGAAGTFLNILGRIFEIPVDCVDTSGNAEDQVNDEHSKVQPDKCKAARDGANQTKCR